MKIYFFIPFVFLLKACAVLAPPKVVAEGRYQQIIANGVPAVEFEWASQEECDKNANSHVGLDSNAINSLRQGTMKILCGINSMKKELPHEGRAINTILDTTVNMRFKTRASCVALVEIMSKGTKNISYEC